MRRLITAEMQAAADLLGSNNESRFEVRRVWEKKNNRQADRSVGVGESSLADGRAQNPRVHGSGARQGSSHAPVPAATPRSAGSRSLASGPAPSAFGFALSVLILSTAAIGIGVCVLIWVGYSGIKRFTGGVNGGV